MEERPTRRRTKREIQDDVDVLIIEEEAPGLFCSKMMSSRHKHHETRSTCKHFYRRTNSHLQYLESYILCSVCTIAHCSVLLFLVSKPESNPLIDFSK